MNDKNKIEKLSEEIEKHLSHLIGCPINKDTISIIQNFTYSYLNEVVQKEYGDFIKNKIKIYAESKENQIYVKPLNLFTGILLYGIEFPPYYLKDTDLEWIGEEGRYTFNIENNDCILERQINIDL